MHIFVVIWRDRAQVPANMRSLVRIKKWDSQPRYKFVVVYRQGGKRVLRYFKSEGAAKAFAATKKIELLNEGRKHGEITEDERQAILVAREKGFTVREAIDHFAKHIELLTRSVTIAIAIEEFVSVREAEGKSHVHLKDLRSRLKAFSVSYGARLVASVMTKEIDQWLSGLPFGAQTRVNYRGILRNFFGFACARGYTEKNPVLSAIRPKVPAKPPGILSVEQTRALLQACDATILPAVAVAAFAGLRRAEIARLDWKHVDLHRGYIEVTAASAKTARRRLVSVAPNLKTWLTPLRQQSGPVCPPPKVYDYRFLKAQTTAGIKSWPLNALRHGFASYFLAAHEDAAKAALQLGHTESQTLFRHYREIVDPNDAERYWQIFPSEVKKVIPFAASVA